jgi:hypothetical protein
LAEGGTVLVNLPVVRLVYSQVAALPLGVTAPSPPASVKEITGTVVMSIHSGKVISN